MSKIILVVFCMVVSCVLAALPAMPDSFYLETYGTPPGKSARTFRKLWYHKDGSVVKYHEQFYAPNSDQEEQKWEHWYDSSKNTTHLWEKVYLPVPSGGTKCRTIAVVAKQTTPPLCVWGDQRYTWSAKSSGTCKRHGQSDTTCDKYTASNNYNGIDTNFEAYYQTGTTNPVSMKVTVLIFVNFWMYVTNWVPGTTVATQNLTIPADCLPDPPVVESSSSDPPIIVSSSEDDPSPIGSEEDPSSSSGDDDESSEDDPSIISSDDEPKDSSSDDEPEESSNDDESEESSNPDVSPAVSDSDQPTPSSDGDVSASVPGSDSNAPPMSEEEPESESTNSSDIDSDSDNDIDGATAVGLSALTFIAALFQ